MAALSSSYLSPAPFRLFRHGKSPHERMRDKCCVGPEALFDTHD